MSQYLQHADPHVVDVQAHLNKYAENTKYILNSQGSCEKVPLYVGQSVSIWYAGKGYGSQQLLYVIVRTIYTTSLSKVVVHNVRHAITSMSVTLMPVTNLSMPQQ